MALLYEYDKCILHAFTLGKEIKPNEHLWFGAHKLDLPWTIPKKQEIASELSKSYLTGQGNPPSPMECCYGHLFGYICNAVYPYWCYNLMRHGPGSLVVEIPNGSSLKLASSRRNGDIIKDPCNLHSVRITYLTINQLRVFAQSLSVTNRRREQIEAVAILCSKVTYEVRENVNGVGMSVLYLVENDILTMLQQRCKNEHMRSFRAECKLFVRAMKRANTKKCHMLELDLQNNKGFMCVNVSVQSCAWRHCKMDMAGKRFKLCSGCRSVRYCCRSHQKRHWKEHHKYHCKSKFSIR